ncbi:MAG: LysR family transcriptional regulator [Xanthomonadaceae bacterium]|nr:LysR family transcriptional regulator [Xanthomonadaceae bacterium]
MATHDSNWLIRTRLKTRQLLLLLALDENRNLHRASESMNMTQPAASKLLKDLEDALGVSLFERLPRGVQPTSYGETMIRHARMAITSLTQAHDDISALKSGLSGQVDVGVIMTPAMMLMPSAIAQVKSASPLLRIGVQLEHSNVLLERLKNGMLDFLIARILEQEDKAKLHYEELVGEPVCAVARVGHPLQSAAQLGLRDLAPLSWILSPQGSILRHRFDMMFRREGLEPPTNVVDTTALLVITSLLQQTDFLHVMPLDVARDYQRFGQLKILPILLPCEMDAFGIITRRHQLLSPGATILLQAIRQTAVRVYAKGECPP